MGLLKKIKGGLKGVSRIASGDVIGGVATIAGAALAGRGSKKAAKKEAKANKLAAKQAAAQAAQVRADAQPYVQSGYAAQNEINGMMGLPTTGPTTGFMESPDYQFRRNEGMRGIERSAAARGGAFSGNALKALNEFNSNLASQEFGNRFSRLSSIAGGGLDAVNLTAGTGTSLAQYRGNALSDAGRARASGIAGQYNAIGQGVQDIASIIGQRNASRDPVQEVKPTARRIPYAAAPPKRGIGAAGSW